MLLLLTTLNNIGSGGGDVALAWGRLEKKRASSLSLRGVNGQAKNGGNERDEGSGDN